MLKNIMKLVVVSAIVLGSLVAVSDSAFAQATCTLNGKDVPCEQLEQEAKGFLAYGAAGALIMIVAGIAMTVFWIMMIVHAASHEVDNKAMWIILMIFTGIIGALIYYFAVKRKFKPSLASKLTQS